MNVLALSQAKDSTGNCCQHTFQSVPLLNLVQRRRKALGMHLCDCVCERESVCELGCDCPYLWHAPLHNLCSHTRAALLSGPRRRKPETRDHRTTKRGRESNRLPVLNTDSRKYNEMETFLPLPRSLFHFLWSFNHSHERVTLDGAPWPDPTQRLTDRLDHLWHEVEETYHNNDHSTYCDQSLLVNSFLPNELEFPRYCCFGNVKSSCKSRGVKTSLSDMCMRSVCYAVLLTLDSIKSSQGVAVVGIYANLQILLKHTCGLFLFTPK